MDRFGLVSEVIVLVEIGICDSLCFVVTTTNIDLFSIFLMWMTSMGLSFVFVR